MKGIMDYFNYTNGKLFAENVDIESIANGVGTPAYIYSKATFLDHLQKIQNAYSDLDTTICYSVKACGNINVLKFMAQAGSGPGESCLRRGRQNRQRDRRSIKRRHRVLQYRIRAGT